jgi:Tfp pilus assembly protein PilZ
MDRVVYYMNYVYIACGAILLLLIMEKLCNKILSVFRKLFSKGRVVEQLLSNIHNGTVKVYLERRHFPRVDTGGRIAARLNDMAQVRPITVTNVSYGGALVQTDFAFKTGEVVDLNMHFPTFPKPAKIKARVVWVRQPIDIDSASRELRAGIEFMHIDQADVKKLAKTVGSLIESR